MDDLTRWERYYLKHSRHGCVHIPRHSKVADRLLSKGLIFRVGFATGRVAIFKLTSAGIERSKALTP